MSDPWAINYFDPPKPTGIEPPKPKTPKLIPEEDRLFQAQKNALKALHGIRGLDPGDDKALARDIRSVEQDIENTYRVIRTYLNKHVNPNPLP